MKKILLTGATGGLGYETYLKLKEIGYNVNPTGRKIKEFQKFDNFFKMDFNNMENIPNDKLEVDVLVHCAALATDTDRMQDYMKVNYTEPSTFIKKLQHVNPQIKVIYVSTPSIYYNGQNRRNVQEYSTVYRSLISDYALSKLKFEEELKASKISTTVLRPRAIFGERDTVLLPKIEKILNNKVAKIPNSGKVLQDFTYVDNVVHSIVCAVEKNLRDNFNVFNITNQQPYYLDEILKQIISAKKIDTKIADLPAIAPMFVNSLDTILGLFNKKHILPVTSHGLKSISTDMTLDSTSARVQLGYFPVVSMEEGLERTIKGYRWQK